MAKVKVEPLVAQSLLDRLTDDYQKAWPTTRAASLSMYRDGVRRDLKALLNTRRPKLPQLSKLPLANASVLNYGVPDIRNYGTAAERDSRALAAAIRQTLKLYEPRILHPQVFLLSPDPNNRSIHFQIEGQLLFGTMQEEITFDTVLEPIEGKFEVS